MEEVDDMSKTIETERLILRPLNMRDAKDVFEWVGDPIVNRFMQYSLYESISQVEKWLSSLRDEQNEFAFCLKDTGKVIGAGSIAFDPETNAYELGYNLNRAYWGNGYATEAAKAMIQWGYQELEARNFCAKHATANTASGNVIKKCGFQLEHYGEYSRFDGSETFEATFYTMHLDACPGL